MGNMKRNLLVIFLLFISTLSLFSCQNSNKMTIQFDSNGGDFIPDMEVFVGMSFNLPIPKNDRYTFDGWYIHDGTYTTLFTDDFDLSTITSNSVSVIAKWTYQNYTYTFETNGGTALNPLEFTSLTTNITFCQTTKIGYTFDQWYIDQALTQSFMEYTVNAYENKTLYAKWIPIVYTMTFESNGGTSVDPIERTVEQSSIIRPNPPTKEGFTFLGWYLDTEFTELYTFDLPINENVTLYAKWEETISDQSHLLTEELPIYSELYGNTNGNLNNSGLVVYDGSAKLHYFSISSSVYAFNPETDVTTQLFTLSSGGRATYLNLNDGILYFIDSSNGYLLSYDLITETLTTRSETENTYVSTTQSWVSFLYHTVMYEQDYVAFQRYLISSDSLSSVQGYGYEQMNIFGTRVYYKPIDALTLNVMSYNGAGKSTIVNLATEDVTDIFESLLYQVDYDYHAFYALILEKGSETALYLYDPIDGLVKVMSATSGNMHSLNYNGNYLYVINDGGVYQIDIETRTYELIHTLASPDAKINIINYWIYIGSTDLIRMNPVTHDTTPVLSE